MKVIYTSALIPNRFNDRKIHYQNSYTSLLNYFEKNDICVIECFSDDMDFFTDFGCDVFITKTHDFSIKNKGVLELFGIKKYLSTKTECDELFFKVTGRYKLLNNSFIEIINQNENYDFYGKLIDNNSQIFTGCFAIKEIVFREFLKYIDFDLMEKNMLNLEKILLDFLTEKNKKCLFINHLNIESPIFGTGDIRTYIL